MAHHLYVERVRASVRARLDAAVFEIAWDAGNALSLTEAAAEARSVLASTPVKTSLSDGLTAREREVLRLLTAGHPDREIAAMLSISPRTVQSHVAGLFAKLGVNTRAEAAAHAVRRGIV
jgi:DNA-binding CsgD family transcriptional regulator